jgi:hypothetical protein
MRLYKVSFVITPTVSLTVGAVMAESPDEAVQLATADANSLGLQFAYICAGTGIDTQAEREQAVKA